MVSVLKIRIRTFGFIVSRSSSPGWPRGGLPAPRRRRGQPAAKEHSVLDEWLASSAPSLVVPHVVLPWNKESILQIIAETLWECVCSMCAENVKNTWSSNVRVQRAKFQETLCQRHCDRHFVAELLARRMLRH